MADDKVCVFEMVDGTVRVVNPFWKAYTLDPAEAESTGKELIGDLEDFFDEQIAAGHYAADKAAARAMKRMTCPAVGLPHRGPFLMAWKLNVDATAVEVDMVKARAIKTDQIRPERNERLKALDVEYQRADEVGDSALKTQIAATKQALRDLPVAIQPDLDAIADPVALNEWQPVWPV